MKKLLVYLKDYKKESVLGCLLYTSTNTSQKVWYLDVLMTRTGNLETDPFFSELLRVIES